MIIAFSGPAASGKGTLAKMLASHLGLPHYDFGLMFRAIAYFNFEINSIKVESGRVLFKGHDVTETLKTEEVGLLTAKIAHRLSDFAISLVKHQDFVCDGRTCGAEIFPNADYKFYVTAEKWERFERRSKNGGNKEIMSEREILDKPRLITPNNAIIIDTTGKSEAVSLQEILSYF